MVLQRYTRPHMRRTKFSVTCVFLLLSLAAVWSLSASAQTKPNRSLGTGHTQPVVAVAFSPDGTSLASAGLDRSIILWDTKTARVQQTFEGHSTPPRAIAFSADGKTLVSCGCVTRNLEQIRWSTDDGKQLDKKILEAGDQFVPQPPTLSRDGRKLAAIFSKFGSMHVHVWDVATGDVLTDVKTGRTGRGDTHIEKIPWIASLSPDGKIVATAEDHSTVRLINTTGDRDEVISKKLPEASSAIFSPDGKTIAAVVLLKTRTAHGYYTSVTIFAAEMKYTKQTFRLGKFDYAPVDVVLSPDGKLLVSISEQGGIKLWDITSGKLKAKLIDADRQHGQQRIAFSPDGRYLAGPNGSRVEIWDVADFE